MIAYIYHVLARIYEDNNDLELISYLERIEKRCTSVRELVSDSFTGQGKLKRSPYIAGEVPIIGEKIVILDRVEEEVNGYWYKVKRIEGYFTSITMVTTGLWTYVGGK